MMAASGEPTAEETADGTGADLRLPATNAAESFQPIERDAGGFHHSFSLSLLFLLVTVIAVAVAVVQTFDDSGADKAYGGLIIFVTALIGGIYGVTLGRSHTSGPRWILLGLLLGIVSGAFAGGIAVFGRNLLNITLLCGLLLIVAALVRLSTRQSRRNAEASEPD